MTGAGALAVFLGGAWAARRPSVTAAERRWFHAVNRLPRSAHAPVWAVMQAGSLGGALIGSLAVAAGGRRRLGLRMAVAGSTTWLAVKAVKPFVRRGRPVAVLDAVRVLGREQTGLGYPSGHAAVVASLVTVAAPELPRRWRALAVAGALGVAGARVYVGAHLPLDVVGGMALGVALGRAERVVTERRPGD